MLKRIALFAPFNPTTGGGGTIFRSLVPHLMGAEVHWFYLSNIKADLPDATLLGPPVLGGGLVDDAINSARLFLLREHPLVRTYAEAIMAWKPDIAWINGMNEGLLIGEILLRLGVPKLHVSVHDDPAGLATKSHRYRHLAGQIDQLNRSLLQHAGSVDVVSDGMRSYYRDRYGVASGVVYRHIDQFAVSTTRPAAEPVIHVGHVGSAYSAEEVRTFLAALRSLERTDGMRFKVLTFGQSPVFNVAADDFPGLVENAGDVPETEVIKRLQRCSFVYSMYSFNRRHRVFRETSLPTKMSTYLMAAKPILAHCPKGSSIVDMIKQFKLGTCVTSLDQAELVDGIRRVLQFNLEVAEVESAIEHFCGRRNLSYLEDCFGLNHASAARPT